MFCLTGKLTSACCSKSKANLLPLPLIRSYLLPHGCCRSVPFLPPLVNKQTGARLTSEWRRRELSPLEVQDGRESVGRRCFSSARTLPFAGVCTAAYLADTHTHAPLTCLPYRLTQERVARPPREECLAYVCKSCH